MSEESARRYNADKPSIDFVNDAFAHAKFVAYVPQVKPLFECAGVWNWMDDGFVDVSAGADAAKAFIEKCGAIALLGSRGGKAGLGRFTCGGLGNAPGPPRVRMQRSR